MNTVNVNAEALAEQKLKELRKLLTATGVAFVQMGATDELPSMDVLTSVGGLLVNECAEISRLLAQLKVLDEMTRPVGSRGQTQQIIRPSELQVHREDFLRS